MNYKTIDAKVLTQEEIEISKLFDIIVKQPNQNLGGGYRMNLDRGDIYFGNRIVLYK